MENEDDGVHEIWRNVPDYEHYSISTFGRCKNRNGRILKPIIDKYAGHANVHIFNETNKKGRKFRIDVLVAICFLSNYDIDVDRIFHIDNNKLNNNVNNLKVMSASEFLKQQHPGRKKVYQFTLDGVHINTFSSVGEAVQHIGCAECTISRALNVTHKKGNYAAGFKWAFENVVPKKSVYAPRPDEIFVPIVNETNQLNFPDHYISNFGNVKRGNDMLIKECIRNGYKSVQLEFNKTRQKYVVHRLVAIFFVPGQSTEHNVVNHLDENRLNNHVSNLAWCTPLENVRHSLHHRYKKVNQIDIETNEIIGTFNSINDASFHLKNNKHAAPSIAHCCKGKKSCAYGFRWQYA